MRRLLPLTVWLCSDTSATAKTSGQSHGGGSAEGEYCPLHRRTVGHQLARHLITACTREGDLVAEAYTTSEATLAAAAGLGRRAVACVPDFPLARRIRARLDAALPHEVAALAAMRPCRPDQMARGLADHLGQVELVIAAPPPYRHDGQTRRASAGDHRCPVCRTGFWMNSQERFRSFMAAAWQVLRPGGRLAVITTARHEHGRLVDAAPRIIREAAGLRFRYVQHIIAVRVPVEGDTLVVQAEPRGLAELRDVRSRALPPVAKVHADVCLFTKPFPVGRDGDR
ncbi:hypothetical protein SAMN04489712_104156 [Thermomonospora echinospora]|uniref:Uncharacterized protein n=1 Tax=Thermomonospora echinospora TaxID=1992 RepID=A0A1H5YTA1_9ACTN|nr:hypothetical protein SAMN04489712_104156 [Thermomonospora echinospora]